MINPNTVLGHFFFQKTDSGNLIGEYSNNPGTGVSTESADLIPISGIPMESVDLKEGCDNRSFLGTYHSSWLEDRDPQFAVLKISQKPGDKTLFKLEWTDKTGLMDNCLCSRVRILRCDCHLWY